MLRAIIIDDEQSGIDMLRILAGRISETIRVVASALQPEEGIELIEDFRPDIVFLDVSMPSMSGFELLDRLHHRDFKLIFSTAHRDYAFDAIKNHAFDYLLKPVAQEDFFRCVQRLVTDAEKDLPFRPKKEPQVYIELPGKDGISYLPLRDIVRLEASRSYTVFYLEGGIRHMASKPLKEFETKLNPELFFRCHHSHIVHLHKVRKFVNHQGYFAQMSDGALIDVSKKSKDAFLERLKHL